MVLTGIKILVGFQRFVRRIGRARENTEGGKIKKQKHHQAK
jgi:hypothetical protein